MHHAATIPIAKPNSVESLDNWISAMMKVPAAMISQRRTYHIGPLSRKNELNITVSTIAHSDIANVFDMLISNKCQTLRILEDTDYFATRSASSNLTERSFDTPSCPIVTP